MSSLKGSQKGLKIKEVGGEVIIFDPKNEVVHLASRRDFLRKAGLAAGAALALPIVESMSVPANAATGRCAGNHAVTVLANGPTKAAATAALYELSVHKAEEVCRSFECDDGECVSTGHPRYDFKPTCIKIGENSWRCAFGYKAVCKCVGGQ